MKKLMKLFGALVLVMGLGLSVASCDKTDDDKQPEDKEYSILGKWKATYWECAEYENGTLVDEYSENITEQEAMYYEFQEGGRGVASADIESDPIVEPFTWSLDGTKLRLVLEGEVLNFDVLKLDATNLELFIFEEYTESGYSYRYQETYRFVRVK
ncbi:MAG: lipocalin family protein [Bacteroidales bacterium]|nr:lipocalin family protein [Bacteroidales bacterium]